MNWLIRNAVVIDPASPFHEQKTDLLIRNGKIRDIGPGLTDGEAKPVDLQGAFLSPGWVDLGAQTGDPGLEHREDLHSAARAAASGGFTALACFPNTEPVVHSKAEVLYIRRNADQELVDFYPVGAVSHNCEGKDITEMLDLHEAGAVAFSDGKKPIQHAGLMLRALLYVKAFDGVILNHPHEDTVAPGGEMHEGLTSTSLGLRGIPSLSEELMLQRDIYLAEYTQSRLHVYNLSTARAVELVRQAKARGLQVSASVAAINLFFSDEDLADFDSNLKVLPPLRGVEDREALKEGLRDGTIDLITSGHVPLEEEAKKLEFPYAKFGAIGLETAFASACTILGMALSPTQWVEKMALNPRRILGLPPVTVAKGEAANFTFFDPRKEWTFEENHIRSRSANTPFTGTTFHGKALGILNKGQVVWVG